MKYEVRFMIDAEEQSEIVDADNAADAAESVTQEHSNPGDTFELIQVQLMENLPASDEIETLTEA